MSIRLVIVNSDVIGVVFLLLLTLPPRSSRTDTLYPYTARIQARRVAHAGGGAAGERVLRRRLPEAAAGVGAGDGVPQPEGVRDGSCHEARPIFARSEEPKSELQSLMRISYAVH